MFLWPGEHLRLNRHDWFLKIYGPVNKMSAEQCSPSCALFTKPDDKRGDESTSDMVPSLKSAGERGRLKKGKHVGVYAYNGWLGVMCKMCISLVVGRFVFFLSNLTNYTWNIHIHEIGNCFCVPTMWPQITEQLDIEMRDDWMEGPRHRLGL